MPYQPLIDYLDGHGARYVSIHHSVAHTAREVAESIHLPARTLAKVVLVMADGRPAMAVVPATRDVDFDLLRAAAGADGVRIATEVECAGRFGGCEVGTVPPFGHLFGVDVYVDRALAAEPTIAFNAGTRTDALVMEWADYKRLAKPALANIILEPAGVGG